MGTQLVAEQLVYEAYNTFCEKSNNNVCKISSRKY